MEIIKYFRPKLARNKYNYISNHNARSVEVIEGGGEYIPSPDIDTSNLVTKDELSNELNKIHTHSNLPVLNKITDVKLNNWDNVVTDWNTVFSISGDTINCKLNFVGDKNISAYGASDSTLPLPTPSVKIIDNVTSTSKEAALSANMGKFLNDKIDNLKIDVPEVNLTDYYKKTEVNNLLLGKSDTGHTHSQYLTQHQDISGKADKTYVDNQLSKKSDVGHTHDQYLTSHQSLINYYKKNDVDTLLSKKSDVGHIHSQYLTSHQDITHKADKTYVDNQLKTKSDTGHTHSQYLTQHQSLKDYAKTVDVDNKLKTKSDTGHTHSQYLTQHQDISGKADKTYVNQEIGKVNGRVDNIHTHSNLPVLNKLTDTKLNNWDNTYTNFNNNFTSEPSKLTIKKDTFVNGNLVVSGNITAFKSDGTIGSLYYNPTSYEGITSTATDEAVTPHTLKLVKNKLDDEVNKNKSILDSFTYYFSSIDQTATTDDIIAAVMGLMEDIYRSGYALKNKNIKNIKQNDITE